jgi:acylaminoacyl-peptidase
VYSDVVDDKRVGIYGGSHGGFLSGWLIGHPNSCNLIKAAVLWNPVINMTYMYPSSDIPDWIYSCCLNKDFSYLATPEENTVFYEKSPYSVIKNAKAPALILIGG